MHWVPGHLDIRGNELADEAAKDAAQGRTSPSDALPLILRHPLATSSSAVRQHTTTILKTKAKESWKKSTRFGRVNLIDPSLPAPSFLKLVANLPRQQASLIMQLRTGHVPLNEYLHQFQRMPSLKCPICLDRTETVAHFLIHCPAYKSARAPLLRRTTARGLTLLIASIHLSLTYLETSDSLLISLRFSRSHP